MNQDGTGRAKVFPYPILETQGISPDRKWLIMVTPFPQGKNLEPRVMAVSLDGGRAERWCAGYCRPAWSSSGKYLFVPVEDGSQTSPGRSLAIPMGAQETLPAFPAGGIEPHAGPEVVAGSVSVPRDNVVAGKDLSHYAYVKTTAHRNLYRVTLP